MEQQTILRQHDYEQDPPFAIQIELCEGCNLYCDFCGLRGIREGPGGPYKFMALHTMSAIVEQIKDLKWNPRIELAMHGEPTMHPKYEEMIYQIGVHLPHHHIMMTTNGAGLIKRPGPGHRIISLFRMGLTVLSLDDYEGVKIVGKIRPYLDVVSDILKIPWYEYPKDPRGNPHQRTGRFISVVEDISKAIVGTHSQLNNHAGAAAPRDDSMRHERCAKPFRELSVRYDGSVAICCNDWRGDYRCGNILTDGLHAIWNSPQMDAARRKLYRGERDFGPCDGCNAKSYRVGLLPDKKGKYVMPEPDGITYEIINEALSHGPLTKPVRRAWECK